MRLFDCELIFLSDVVIALCNVLIFLNARAVEIGECFAMSGNRLFITLDGDGIAIMQSGVAIEIGFCFGECGFSLANVGIGVDDVVLRLENVDVGLPDFDRRLFVGDGEKRLPSDDVIILLHVDGGDAPVDERDGVGHFVGV